MSQKEKVIDLMKYPVPKKIVGIVKLQMKKESTMLYGTSRFHEPKQAAKMVKNLFEYCDREIMVVMSLDIKQTPLAIEIVAVGRINACAVDMRDLFKHAILNNAVTIICFHNHLSGIPKASREDLLITRRIKDAGELLGITLLDHIIIGAEDEYISLREQGEIVYKENNQYEEISINIRP